MDDSPIASPKQELFVEHRGNFLTRRACPLQLPVGKLKVNLP
jgi:hypothetical protein